MANSQEKLKKVTSTLPDKPGIYKFINSKKEVLYVGKATSLRSRVRSYFMKDLREKRSPLIEKMMGEARGVKYEETDSVLEAIILESALIKKLQPPYNTADKDQKSWNYVVITKEEFPKVLIRREREITHPNPLLLQEREPKVKFGPFTNGGQLKEALKIVRRIFPFRDMCNMNQNKPCFNYQIGLCPGVCVDRVTKSEYAKIISHIKTFFEGNKKKLIKDLEKEMRSFAKNKEFEKAEKIKRSIFALKHIQDIALIRDSKLVTRDSTNRIEAYDISHISGSHMVGVMTVVNDGEVAKSEYRMFKIRGQTKVDDLKALSEVLDRRFNHPEWPFPDLIVTDGGFPQLNVAEELIRGKKLNISVVSVVKDDKHKAREILSQNPESKTIAEVRKREIILANIEAHRFAVSFHKKLRGKLPK